MPPAKRSKKKAAAKTKAVPVKKLVDYADELQDQVGQWVEDSRKETVQWTAELALTLVDFQRKTFDKTFKGITKIQQRSEKVINDYAKKASWMPGEGRDVVREWSSMLEKGRADFQGTMDKSYELLGDYFRRLQKESGKGRAKKRAPAKKKPAASAKKRIADAKKKVSAAKKRAAAKKAPAKAKPRAKKKPAAKPKAGN